MAGRAGRRGKDDRGTCILMLDKKLDKEELVHMTCGTGSALMSEFKLTYYSILNLLRRASGEEDAEYVIQRSFHQFQHTREVPRKKRTLEEITAEADGIQLDMSDAKAELVRLQNATRDARTALMHHAVDPEKLTRDILKPGRLVRVRDGDDEPDRRRQGQDASAEEQQRCVGTLENGRVGISRARREWFLRRINAVSDASDDVRRVTVRTV